MSERHANLLDAGAIVGIGATEFSKDSGRSDLQPRVRGVRGRASTTPASSPPRSTAW